MWGWLYYKHHSFQQNPSYSTSPVIGSTVNTAALTQSLTTDYVGNIIYENNALKRILVDGGYYEGGIYHYYLADHLGNNHVVAKADGTSIQSNSYYPFGMHYAPGIGYEKQPYKYNGKELDQMHGLNLYDYSARYYEPAIGRFTTVDPLTEKFYSWSPYVYTFNNPLRFTDPTGEEPQDGIWDELKKALKQVGNEILTAAGLSKEQIQSDNPAVLEDASQKRQEFTETMHTVNETMLSVVPGADVAYKVANDREVTAGDVAWAVVGAVPAGKGAKGLGAVAKGAKAVDKANDAATKGKTILNFSEAAAKHMDEAGRFVPVQILDDAIKTTKGVPDPRGSRALMHTTDMVKNGKTYKLEVLYDKKTNSVWHFQYSR